jgi:chemotaxis protein MotA
VAQNPPASSGTKKGFDIFALVGVFGGLLGVMGSWIAFEHGNVASLAQASPPIIVFGGTFACLLIAFPPAVVFNFPKYLMKALTIHQEDPVVVVQTFARLAERARREGLLSLEEEAQTLPSAFMRNGIQEVVDGTPLEQIQLLLETEIECMEERHKLGADVFEQGGGFAPTMGIVGTVLGLMSTLGSLADSGTEQLGESIAVAFVATFFGILSANFFWLPMAKRLRRKSEEEVAYYRMIVEGILAIQAGDSPRVVGAKLEGFLPPAQKARLRAAEQSGSFATAAAGA